MNRWPARAISNILWGKTGLLKLSVTISLQPLDGFFNFLGNIMLGGPEKAHRLLCVAQRAPSFARSPCCPSSDEIRMTANGTLVPLSKTANWELVAFSKLKKVGSIVQNAVCR